MSEQSKDLHTIEKEFKEVYEAEEKIHKKEFFNEFVKGALKQEKEQWMQYGNATVNEVPVLLNHALSALEHAQQANNTKDRFYFLGLSLGSILAFVSAAPLDQIARDQSKACEHKLFQIHNKLTEMEEHQVSLKFISRRVKECAHRYPGDEEVKHFVARIAKYFAQK